MKIQHKFTPEQYRDAATRLYGGPHLTVSQWGAFHRTTDGAFVEMIAWVPDERVEAPAEEKKPE